MGHCRNKAAFVFKSWCQLWPQNWIQHLKHHSNQWKWPSEGRRRGFSCLKDLHLEFLDLRDKEGRSDLLRGGFAAPACEAAQDAPLGHLQARRHGRDPGQHVGQSGHVGLHVTQQLLQLVQHCRRTRTHAPARQGRTPGRARRRSGGKPGVTFETCVGKIYISNYKQLKSHEHKILLSNCGHLRMFGRFDPLRVSRRRGVNQPPRLWKHLPALPLLCLNRKGLFLPPKNLPLLKICT